MIPRIRPSEVIFEERLAQLAAVPAEVRVVVVEGPTRSGLSTLAQQTQRLLQHQNQTADLFSVQATETLDAFLLRVLTALGEQPVSLATTDLITLFIRTVQTGRKVLLLDQVELLKEPRALFDRLLQELSDSRVFLFSHDPIDADPLLLLDAGTVSHSGLSKAEVRTFLSQLGISNADDHAIDFLFLQTKGNPFLVKSTLAQLRQSTKTLSIDNVKPILAATTSNFHSKVWSELSDLLKATLLKMAWAESEKISQELAEEISDTDRKVLKRLAWLNEANATLDNEPKQWLKQDHTGESLALSELLKQFPLTDTPERVLARLSWLKRTGNSSAFHSELNSSLTHLDHLSLRSRFVALVEDRLLELSPDAMLIFIKAIFEMSKLNRYVDQLEAYFAIDGTHEHHKNGPLICAYIWALNRHRRNDEALAHATKALQSLPVSDEYFLLADAYRALVVPFYDADRIKADLVRLLEAYQPRAANLQAFVRGRVKQALAFLCHWIGDGRGSLDWATSALEDEKESAERLFLKKFVAVAYQEVGLFSDFLATSRELQQDLEKIPVLYVQSALDHQLGLFHCRAMHRSAATALFEKYSTLSRLLSDGSIHLWVILRNWLLFLAQERLLEEMELLYQQCQDHLSSTRFDFIADAIVGFRKLANQMSSDSLSELQQRINETPSWPPHSATPDKLCLLLSHEFSLGFPSTWPDLDRLYLSDDAYTTYYLRAHLGLMLIAHERFSEAEIQFQKVLNNSHTHHLTGPYLISLYGTAFLRILKGEQNEAQHFSNLAEKVDRRQIRKEGPLFEFLGLFSSPSTSNGQLEALVANVKRVFLSNSNHRLYRTMHSALSRVKKIRTISNDSISSGLPNNPTLLNADIVINCTNSTVRLKDLEVDLKKKPILMGLLIFLARNTGKSFSKEQITSQVWFEVYNPLVHDRRIYTSISRLNDLFTRYQDQTPILCIKGKYLFSQEIKKLVIEEADSPLTPHQEWVLKFLATNGTASRLELQRHLKVSAAVLKRELKALADQGAVRKVGDSRATRYALAK